MKYTLDSSEQDVKTDSDVIAKLMLISEQNHLGLRVLYQSGPVPAGESVFVSGFRYTDAANDPSFVPRKALKNMAIVESHAKVLQKLIGHEITPGDGLFGLEVPPLAIPEPEVVFIEKPELEKPVKKRSASNLEDWVIPAITVGVAALAGLATLIVYAIVTDPNYVAVIEDEHGRTWWLECLNWPA